MSDHHKDADRVRAAMGTVRDVDKDKPWAIAIFRALDEVLTRFGMDFDLIGVQFLLSRIAIMAPRVVPEVERQGPYIFDSGGELVANVFKWTIAIADGREIRELTIDEGVRLIENTGIFAAYFLTHCLQLDLRRH